MKANFNKKLIKAIKSLVKYTFPAPHTGIILGSGLGTFLDSIPGVEIPFTRIKGFPHTTVKGHKGILKLGAGIAVCAGRFHLYEGYPVDDVVLPVFLLHSLGVKTLILTNAAGGINPEFRTGDLVVIKDHINLTGVNPLVGLNRNIPGPRFPDASGIYSRDLRDLAAAQDFLKLGEGVYAGMQGPSYETPAEIQMLKRAGADMVGMSTVQEALAASFLGLKVLGISCIANMAAGIAQGALDHADVIKTGERVAGDFSRLLFFILKKLGCPLRDSL